MPWALLVKPSGLPPQDPYTQLFYLLIILGLPFSLILNSVAWHCWPSHIRCLAQPTCPRFLHHCMSKGVHELPGILPEARRMSVFDTKIICFIHL